ncbi:hypothetical protein ABZ468_25730 [Streptomyces sp. NPDC005708]|uniref:hypothetical protein n=1 Tax=Streptomyces sp. NPDC005708 TaxID=3154564 RepID=UPI0034038D97
MIASMCQGARKLVRASGVHRLTARQLRHELRLAEHQLAGAGEYIAGLERDRGELSAELDEANEMLVKVAQRVVDLEGQLREAAQLRETNKALRAELANDRAVRPLQPATGPDASALPDGEQEFADQTATAWRASG